MLLNKMFFLLAKDDRSQIDREERLRLIREKQNEERQRKLEELKQQVSYLKYLL